MTVQAPVPAPSRQDCYINRKVFVTVSIQRDTGRHHFLRSRKHLTKNHQVDFQSTLDSLLSRTLAPVNRLACEEEIALIMLKVISLPIRH